MFDSGSNANLFGHSYFEAMTDDIPEPIKKSPYYDIYVFAVELARSAGRMIADAFNSPKNITFKGTVDLVTETDQAVEQLVMGRIRERFPDHTFVAEEVQASRALSVNLFRRLLSLYAQFKNPI